MSCLLPMRRYYRVKSARRRPLKLYDNYDQRRLKDFSTTSTETMANWFPRKSVDKAMFLNWLRKGGFVCVLFVENSFLKCTSVTSQFFF